MASGHCRDCDCLEGGAGAVARTSLARALVIPTYWLAYIYQWQVSRFLVSQGGVVGPNVGPVRAFLGIPLAAGIAWVIDSLIIGGTLGSIVMAIMTTMRRGERSPA